MSVENSHQPKIYKELYFLLPDYWSFDLIQQKNHEWMFVTLRKLKCFVVEQKTFYAEGHTMPANKDLAELSSQLKQTYLMLCNPIYVQDELSPITSGSKEVSFLGYFPFSETNFIISKLLERISLYLYSKAIR